MKEPSFDSTLFNRAQTIVDNWDFSLTIEKLQEKNYAGWSLERAQSAERNYKRYLCLICGLGGYKPVPNSDIDRFWHEHILDTERYAKDCNNLFGHMLHHYPYFGMRGKDDNSNWLNASAFSNRIWQELFSEPLYHSRSTLERNQSEGDQAMTTINISITVTGGKADIKSSASYDNGSTVDQSEQIVEIDGKKYILTPAPLEVVPMGDMEKCPQKCPNEG